MFFPTTLLSCASLFSHLAAMVRAGVQAIARAFRTSPAPQEQPQETALASHSTSPAPALVAEEDEAQEAAGEEEEECVTIAQEVETHIDHNNNNNNKAVRTTNEDDERADASVEQAADVPAEPADKCRAAIVTHPAEASAIYAFMCLLDVANCRLDHVTRRKSELESEATQLRRRVETADAERREQTEQLEAQLRASRAREQALRVQVEGESVLKARYEYDVEHQTRGAWMAYEVMAQMNAQLREDAVTLKLRVADLEADLAEATADPRAEVEFLLAHMGELELELEAAYARLGGESAPHGEVSIVDVTVEVETSDASVVRDEMDHLFESMDAEIALDMAQMQAREAAEVCEFEKIERQIELETAKSVGAAPMQMNQSTAAPRHTKATRPACVDSVKIAKQSRSIDRRAPRPQAIGKALDQPLRRQLPKQRHLPAPTLMSTAATTTRQHSDRRQTKAVTGLSGKPRWQ